MASLLPLLTLAPEASSNWPQMAISLNLPRVLRTLKVVGPRPYHMSLVEKFVKENTFDNKSIRTGSTHSVLKTLQEKERVDLVDWFPEQTVKVIWQNASSPELSSKHLDIAWIMCQGTRKSLGQLPPRRNGERLLSEVLLPKHSGGPFINRTLLMTKLNAKSLIIPVDTKLRKEDGVKTWITYELNALQLVKEAEYSIPYLPVWSITMTLNSFVGSGLR
eukprot:g30644.t1